MVEHSSQEIIIIGPAHPLRGGLATFNERLAKQFIQEGYTTSIYTFSLQYPSFLFPGTTQYSSSLPPDINIKVCINSINPFNWIKVGFELKKKRPSIVVVRYWLPFMGPCLGTILRLLHPSTKVICIADNIIPHEKRFGDKLFTKYFIGAIHAFVVMSEKVLNDLQKFTSKPAIQIVHPLYDNFGELIAKTEARKHLQLSQEAPIILFFGFIRAYKGLDLLLKAMALLKKQMPALQLLIAGEFYEDRKAYDALIEELDIKDQLILHTDFIPDEKVKWYLSAADFVIQPYKNATQSGVTPLAYHFEKPMLVTNVGGLPQLVPHNKVGWVCDPTPESIAEGIATLYNKGEDYFLPRLILEKQKYTWNKASEAIIKLAKD